MKLSLVFGSTVFPPPTRTISTSAKRDTGVMEETYPDADQEKSCRVSDLRKTEDELLNAEGLAEELAHLVWPESA